MKQYTVTGMSCAACSARVEKAVSSLDGVSSCSVNLLTGSMGVEGSATPSEVIKAVEDAGYDAAPAGGTAAKAAQAKGPDPLAEELLRGSFEHATGVRVELDQQKILFFPEEAEKKPSRRKKSDSAE